ncbi:MAG: hypothetical protein QMD07_02020, partial [Thermodesulfovibrionales bacterium]|nr:hypothetical protein [Thermodesulfovibrionales bacterium]
MEDMIKRLKKWAFSLQGKFIIVASTCIFIFTTAGSFFIISREESLYKRDIVNQGNVRYCQLFCVNLIKGQIGPHL